MKYVKKILLLIVLLLTLTSCFKTEYNVVFKNHDGTIIESQTVQEGLKATPPEAPVREGYTFKEWSVSFDSVTQNLEVIAKYEINQYEVKFISDGNEIKSETVEHGQAATAPENPTKEGYTFTGWTVEFNNVTSNLEVVAKFEPTTYEVIFISDGNEIKSETVEHGQAATAPENPTKEGHTFTGWTVEFNNVTSNLEVVAKYEINQYEVKFISDGNEIKSETVEHGQAATAPENPTKEGYTFMGWTVEFNNVTSNLDVVAKFEPITYEVKFISDGVVVDTQNITYGNSAVAPTNPTRVGHTFNGWDISFNNVTSNLEVTAQFKINTYQVKFYHEGILVDSQLVNYGESASLPDEPTKVGHTFVGWSIPLENITSNLDIVAKFDPITYEVKFISDGEVVNTETVEHDSVIPNFEPTAKVGYKFEYWYQVEGTAFNFTIPITSGVTLIAYWSKVGKTTLEKINEDIDSFISELYLSQYELNLPAVSKVNGSTISWTTTSPYILDSGMILPVVYSDGMDTTAELEVIFTLNGESVTKVVEINLVRNQPVLIAESKMVPFENLTVEFDVVNSELELFFEAGGSVPYVSLSSFFDLLDGFVWEGTEFTYTQTGEVLEVEYGYYDSIGDEYYSLILTVDAANNWIYANDPAFYWIYVYSTETNYGRHIKYVNHPDEHFGLAYNVVYELSKYNLDIPTYNNQILVPFYLANQLFLGPNYYNLYYNGDKIYGVYGLPSYGDYDYEIMKTSSYNGKKLPVDLRIHNFNMFAFNLDYFYGLKDFAEVETYYNVLYEKKDQLLNENADVVDRAISEILLLYLDEPHTSFGYPSYYNELEWEGPPSDSLSNYGPRFQQWYMDGYIGVDEAIANKWGVTDPTIWAAYSELRPFYWFLNNEYAVLSLDNFDTADIYESNSHDNEIIADILGLPTSSVILPTIVGGTKYFHYNMSTVDDEQLELIVKGLDATYLPTYIQKLKDFGYTHVKKSTTDPDKKDGYFQKTIDGINFMVQVTYDEIFEVLYLGVAKEVPLNYEAEWPLILDFVWLLYLDSAVYLEFMIELMLEEKPTVKNIILDLTWNTGGNLGALFRVVGFVTNEPFKVSEMQRDTGYKATRYVQVTGVPNYSTIKWSLLVSPVTFSAGNSLTTIFRENNLGPIIGMKTGGGACTVTPVLLPIGTAFSMSSNDLEAYRTGSGTELDPYLYHDVELGIVPDHIITDHDDLYDEIVLLEFLTN